MRDADTRIIQERYDDMKDQIDRSAQAEDKFKLYIHSIFDEAGNADSFISYIQKNINNRRNPHSIERWVNGWNDHMVDNPAKSISSENRIPVIQAIEDYRSAAFYQ